jgi:hypothetical protein
MVPQHRPQRPGQGNTMNPTRKFVSSLLVAGMLAAPAAATTAVAQDQATSEMETPAPEAPGASSVDDGKLKSFAVAYLEVNRIAQTYQPQIQSETDPQKQEQLRTEAANGMVKAVEDAEGITVTEYQSILTTAQQDPGLAKKIGDFVREAAESEAQESQ